MILWKTQQVESLLYLYNDVDKNNDFLVNVHSPWKLILVKNGEGITSVLLCFISEWKQTYPRFLMYKGNREKYFSFSKNIKTYEKNAIVFLELLSEISYLSNIKLDFHKQLPLQEPPCSIQKYFFNIWFCLPFLKGQSFHMQTSGLIWIRHQSAGKTCYALISDSMNNFNFLMSLRFMVWIRIFLV